jgi:hypothetical protein
VTRLPDPGPQALMAVSEGICPVDTARLEPQLGVGVCPVCDMGYWVVAAGDGTVRGGVVPMSTLHRRGAVRPVAGPRPQPDP